MYKLNWHDTEIAKEEFIFYTQAGIAVASKYLGHKLL